jgi:hypothetical protein
LQGYYLKWVTNKKNKMMSNNSSKEKEIRKSAKLVQLNNFLNSSDNSNIRQLRSSVVQLYPTQRA